MRIVLACDSHVPTSTRNRLMRVLLSRGERAVLVEIGGSAKRFVATLARLEAQAVFHIRMGDGGGVLATQLSGSAHPLVLTALTRSPKRSKSGLRIGLAFNLKRIASAVSDEEAEYDSAETIASLSEAIAAHGHTVVPLEVTAELPTLLAASGVDVVFNFAEGLSGRNREAQVPNLCEMLGIEYTGSDAATQTICLDKALAKRVLGDVRTPRACLLTTGAEPFDDGLRYPVIVKPNHEGSSKGIDRRHVVDDEASARRVARRLIKRYAQPAIVEEYVTGRELTVAVLGDRKRVVLPPLEILLTDPSGRPVYDYTCKQNYREHVRYECPARLTKAELRDIETTCLDAFEALGCRDVARIDLRLDSRGRAHVLEVNPLPGLSPVDSDLCLITQGMRMDYTTLVGKILQGAIRRHNDRVRAA